MSGYRKVPEEGRNGRAFCKKEQLINWKILKQSEGQLLATNAYALLTSDYFSFAKTQCAVFKGTDRAVFLDKREFTGPIYTQIEEAVALY